MIKAVIFDMYETLITHYACPLYFSEQMALDAGIPIEEFRSEWRMTEQQRTLGILSTDEVIASILRKHQCYTPQLLEKIMTKRTRTKESCFEHLHPEILSLLDSLKNQNILIGLISNCFSEEAKVIRESILYSYFDAAFLSCEEQIAKPDTDIYQKCMNTLQVKPEECLYIGDGGSHELETAKALGMHPLQAIWYRNEKSEHVIKIKEEFEQVEMPMHVIDYL